MSTDINSTLRLPDVGSTLYFCALALLGAFLPSSTSGNVSYSLIALSYVVALILLVYGAYRFGASEMAIIFCALPILIVLVLATIVGALDDIRPAKFGIYAAIGVMLCLRWKSIPPNVGRRLLIVISCVNIFVGAAMIAGWEPITSAVTRYYSVFFDDLVVQMTALHKPVLTYGSHAPAAFFLYCYYWLNFRTFEVMGSRLHLALAVLQAGLCCALFSHASFIFAGLAFGEMAWSLWKHSHVYAFALAMLLVLTVPRIAAEFDPFLSSWPDLGRAASSAIAFVWTDKEGGIGGRFGTGGDMNSPVSFIEDHPLRPIGISTKAGEFTLVDSGPIEYMIRGSMPLVFLVYCGLWFFLRAHLKRLTALRLYLCILAMEFGFAILTFQRTLLLLPFFIVYLSNLEECALLSTAHLYTTQA